MLSTDRQFMEPISCEEDVKTFFDRLKSQGRYVLTEPEAKKILAFAGIPITKEAVAHDAGEAQEMAEKIGYPVVMKIVSPQIMHKTDSGGIRTNLRSPLSVKEAYSGITEKARQFDPHADLHGVLIQEFLSSGVETIVGVSTDEQFGQVMMFGLGGVYVEAYRDVTFRILPIDRSIGREMLEEIKGAKMLEGYRNLPRVDKDRLAGVLVRLSDFSFRFKEDIQEIDVNPLYCDSTGMKAMDALMVLRR